MECNPGWAVGALTERVFAGGDRETVAAFCADVLEVANDLLSVAMVRFQFDSKTTWEEVRRRDGNGSRYNQRWIESNAGLW